MGYTSALRPINNDTTFTHIYISDRAIGVFFLKCNNKIINCNFVRGHYVFSSQVNSTFG